MPRRLWFCPAGMPVHVVQRGNNRQVCFAKEADMAAYANIIRTNNICTDYIIGI
jgi:putative transposase